jgi:hypothetical protein
MISGAVNGASRTFFRSATGSTSLMPHIIAS